MLGLATYLALLLAVLAGTLWRPPIAMAGILGLYGLKQWGQSTSGFLVEYRQLTNIAVTVIALIGVAIAIRRRARPDWRLPKVLLPILILYGYAFVSVVWAPDTSASLERWQLDGPYLLTVMILPSLLIADFDDLATGFRSTVLLGATLCGLILVFGHWGFRGLLLYGDIEQGETNPLAIASLAGTVVLPAAVWVGTRMALPKRLILAACIPLGVAIVLRSGSRGQLLALAPAILLAWPVAFRARSIRSVVALCGSALLIGILAWWSSTWVHIDSSRWQSDVTAGQLSGRLGMAATLLGASSHSLRTVFFGLGNGSALQVLGIYPHIAGIEVLGEEGIIGFLIYLWALLLTVQSIVRLSRRLRNDPQRGATLAIITATFAFELILSWKQGSLLSSVYVFAYAIMIGRLESGYRSRVPVDSPQEAYRHRAAAPLRFSNLLR